MGYVIPLYDEAVSTWPVTVETFQVARLALELGLQRVGLFQDLLVLRGHEAEVTLVYLQLLGNTQQHSD